MEQKRNIGWAIGQAINLLTAEDAEFKEHFLSRNMACAEHKDKGKNALLGTEYSTDCVSCNAIIMDCHTRVEVITKRILHFDIAVQNALGFKEQQKAAAAQTPVSSTKKVLSSTEFKVRIAQGGKMKLLKNKQCVVTPEEQITMYCAGAAFTEQTGSFPQHYLPVWLEQSHIDDDAAGVLLEIPATSKARLDGIGAAKGVTVTLSGHMHSGNYGVNCVAQWTK